MCSLILIISIASNISLASARNETLVHGWVPEPHGRGTWSILWSCLVTIFICTWSSLHLEVPKRHGFWYLLFRKLGWMTVAVLAPEFMLGIAAESFFETRAFSKYCAKIGKPKWTVTQLQFACASGFQTRGSTPEEPKSTCNFRTLQSMIEENRVDDPPLSDEELESRGKSDVFLKIILVLQITWFLVQTLVRVIMHYQITALEVMTVAFVFCSIVSMGFFMKLPQNVEYPVFLEVRDAAPVNEEAKQRRGNEQKFKATWADLHILAVLMSLFGCGFGAIHCSAWNSSFPTAKERLAWRICASATTAVPVPISFLF